MKRAAFRAVPGKGGFIRTSLAPINEREGRSLSVGDLIMLSALILGALAIARFLVAN